jgi:hypothetical protein
MRPHGAWLTGVGFLRTRKERQGGQGVGIEQGRITVQ